MFRSKTSRFGYWMIIACITTALLVAACAAPTAPMPAPAPTQAPAAAQPTAAPEPTTAPAESSAQPVQVVLMMAEPKPPESLIKNWEADLGKKNISLVISAVPDFMNMLSVQAPAGELPDLIALNPYAFNMLSKIGIDKAAMPIDPALTKDFLPGALASITLDKMQYGLPWWRWYCSSWYISLAVNPNGKDPKTALNAALYLVDPDQQKANFEELASKDLQQYPWYPPRQFLDDDLSGCATGSGDWAEKPLADDEYNVLQGSSAVKDLMPGLETSLKSGGWLMTEFTFNTQWANGVATAGEAAQVQVAVAPVTGPEGDFAADNFPKYLDSGVIIGAVVVAEPRGVCPSPPCSYGMWMKGDSVTLMNEKGEEQAAGGIVEYPYGKASGPGFLQPFATVERKASMILGALPLAGNGARPFARAPGLASRTGLPGDALLAGAEPDLRICITIDGRRGCVSI